MKLQMFSDLLKVLKDNNISITKDDMKILMSLSDYGIGILKDYVESKHKLDKEILTVLAEKDCSEEQLKKLVDLMGSVRDKDILRVLLEFWTLDSYIKYETRINYIEYIIQQPSFEKAEFVVEVINSRYPDENYGYFYKGIFQKIIDLSDDKFNVIDSLYSVFKEFMSINDSYDAEKECDAFNILYDIIANSKGIEQAQETYLYIKNIFEVYKYFDVRHISSAKLIAGCSNNKCSEFVRKNINKIMKLDNSVEIIQELDKYMGARSINDKNIDVALILMSYDKKGEKIKEIADILTDMEHDYVPYIDVFDNKEYFESQEDALKALEEFLKKMGMEEFDIASAFVAVNKKAKTIVNPDTYGSL